MRTKERYPKNVSFYLEEDKYHPSRLYFKFLTPPQNQQQITKKNNYDDIEKKVKFAYFHPDFIRKTDILIKEDNDKAEFINFITSIRYGNKSFYTQEQLKINNNFIYSLFTSKHQKLKLKVNFAVFFEKTPRVKPYSTYIQKLYFFDVCKEKDAPEKKIIRLSKEFEQNFKYNNDLEFDKMICLGDLKEKLFYEMRDTDIDESQKNRFYLFPFEIKTRNELFKIIKIFDKEYLQGFDPAIWELKFPINNVLKKIGEIDKFNYNSFFDKDVLDFHPSKMETKLINMNNNFILSGRPGTGKTVIILIKIIMNFLRCIYEHSNIIKGKVDFNYINNVILEKIFNYDIDIENKNEESEENQFDKNINKNKVVDNIITNNLKDKIQTNENEEYNADEEEEISENTITATTIEEFGSEGATYKIIFTSLSQSLCAFAENTFIRGLKRSPNISCDMNPTNQKTYEKMSSFVHHQKYPLFINFRKLIFMIDGSLTFQFFDRPNKNKLKKRQDDCDIRYYPDCEYDVMVNLSYLVYRPGNIYFYRREYLEDPLVMTEINEDTFYNNFNNQIKTNKILNNEKSHISTYEVYSNIISIIKGSIKSYLVGALSLDDYLSTGKKVCPFDNEQKREIYKIFEQYELWKLKNKYFDFQDVVNYLIREVNIELVPQNKKMFDLVFIDEVQDFSINQLYLLFLISRDIKVLAGDTCQTISKINTFRFADLNNVLYTFASIKNIKINEPKNIEINLNYRCQSNILKFAHLIYEMIRTFFSHTLDKVRMDFSTQVGGGEKPYIIPPEIKVRQGKRMNYKNLELLENKTGFDYFLKGLTDNNLFLDDPKSIINISFSVNHCVICRNNNVVKELNKKYNNKIFCSTAFESKGLEYEIVILYNFFKDSLPFVKEIWTYILKNITFKQVENNYLYLIKENLEYEGFPSSIKDQIYSIFNKKFNIELSNEFKTQFSIYNFCSELKELYVAVTRAKNRLFIYEEDKDFLRLFMQKIYNFDIVSQEVFDKKNEDNNDKITLLLNQEDNYNLLNKKVIGCLKFINNSRLTKEKLLKKAYDEYNQDNEYNYKKALYLFQVLNEEIMKTKCLINLKFIEMQRLKGTDNPTIKAQFISLNNEIFELIQKINYDDNKQIKGEILINLERYDEALDYFKGKNNFKKCGIVLSKKKEYENALSYFIKGKEYSFAISCLIEIKNYPRLYDFLLEFKEEFDLEHIQYFYKITCDKFFKKYMIPIKDSKKGFKKRNIGKQEKNKENKDENPKGGIINVKCDLDNKNSEEKFFDENNNLYDLMQSEKLKIKSPFILTSEPNTFLFDLDNENNNIYSIKKTREEIINLINTFKDLLNFMLVYLQIIISKTEKNNNQELFISESKKLIQKLENKLKENLSNEALLDIMEKLVIRKHEFKVIIIGILKNIEAQKYIYDLYEINVFKINILEHIKADLPIVYKKITDYLEADLLSQETIKQVVSYSKYLPIKEDDVISYLNYIFINSYNFKAIIGLTKKNDIKTLLDLSVLTKKLKMLEFLIKTLNIDFINGKVNNDLNKNVRFSKYEILHYLEQYVIILIDKFLKYFLNENRNQTKINSILEKIKIFPKLYEILNLLIKEKDKSINLFSLIDDINEINCDDIINFEKGDLDMKKYIKLISIITKIKIIHYLLSKQIISQKFDFSNDIETNSKIFDVLMKNKAKILDIYNYINEDNTKNNKKNTSFNSFINVYMLDKKETIYIIDFISYDYNTYFNNYFIKLEYYLQNDKVSEDSSNKNNKIFFNSSRFISLLNNSNIKFINHLLDYLDENEKVKQNINPKYLHVLDLECSLYEYDDKYNYEQFIKYINEFYYQGEYPLNKDIIDNYISQCKIILDNFNNMHINFFGHIINKLSSSINKKGNKNSDLINYILFTNLIGGGIIKVNYNNVLTRFVDIFKDLKNIKEVYCKKDFSYFDALKSIIDNFNPNLNQLLVIIWLRKIYNIFFTILYDEKNIKNNKLFIDKNKCDIELNIHEIKEYIASEKDFSKYNFIDKYLSILSSFIKNVKTNKDNNKAVLPEIKIYFSEIYYSLENTLSYCEEKIKTKIKLSLDEMKIVPLLISNNKDLFKEVIIINDSNISKNEITYIKVDDLYLHLLKLDEEEDIHNDSPNEDDYEDDYDEIEENLLKGRKRVKDDYY